MPLELLAILVVAGISGVVALVHLFGWTGRAAWTDDAAARDAFLLDYPQARIVATHRADDGRAAIFETSDGRLGFLAAMGGGRMTRLLPPGTLGAVRKTDRGFDLRLNDFAAPRFRLSIADEGHRRALASLLNGDSAP